MQVLSTAVSSPTSAVARLKIAADAPLGFRDLKVTTGAEHAALLDGFEVTPAPAVQPTPTVTGVRRRQPGGGAGPPSTCADRAAPRATIAGRAPSAASCTCAARASDAGCAAAISVAGRVARVEVAISRAAGRRKCRFVAARRPAHRRRASARSRCG